MFANLERHWWILFLLVAVIGGIVVAVKSSKSSKQQLGAPQYLSQPTLQSQAQAVAQANSDYEQLAVAEALRRDPTLGADSSPPTLARLDQSVQTIKREWELQRQVQAVRDQTPPSI